MIATLTTQRLTLRAPTMADFPVHADIFMSDRARYMDGPVAENRTWNQFACDVAGWVVQGFGYWTVTDRTSDEVLGFTGTAHPPCYPEREIGWMVTQTAEGKGIAFEAARAVLNHTLGPDCPTLVSYVDPPNIRSIALAERLGATLDPTAAAPSPGDLVYRHLDDGGQS